MPQPLSVRLILIWGWPWCSVSSQPATILPCNGCFFCLITNGFAGVDKQVHKDLVKLGREAIECRFAGKVTLDGGGVVEFGGNQADGCLYQFCNIHRFLFSAIELGKGPQVLHYGFNALGAFFYGVDVAVQGFKAGFEVSQDLIIGISRQFMQKLLEVGEVFFQVL